MISIATPSCATSFSHAPTEESRFAVETYAKAAQLIQSSDWIGYDEGIEEVFSMAELEVLGQYRAQLDQLVSGALSKGESVYGAKLAAHFRFDGQCYAALRQRILTPRAPYAWEGQPNRDLAEDVEFQYQTAYIDAIKEIRNADLARALSLSPEELARITAQASGGRYADWGRWVLKKLGSGGERISSDTP